MVEETTKEKEREREIEGEGGRIMQLQSVVLPAPRVCNLICNRNQVGANRRIGAE